MKGGIFRRCLACAAGIAALMGMAHASEKALEVDSAVEIPEIWSPDQHVYTKGNLRVNRVQLDGLERWMDENAPNWTVVLMSNSRGESYTEAGGRRHQGMDAVEFALGQTLPNKTAFGELKHPQTGEANGAYFLLFLQERKISYHASAVYDKRNLGENRWQGNLDAPAIRAMRGGGRILDAAKDTITNIDGQLARKLAAAEAEKRRAAERQRRMIEETAALITEAQNIVEVAQNRGNDLFKDLGESAGDLLPRKVVGWTVALEGAKRLQSAGEVESAGREAQATKDAALTYLSALDAYVAARGRFANLKARIESVKLADESILSRTTLEEAKSALAKAEAAHAQANSSYQISLQEAESLLQRAIQIGQETARAIARIGLLNEQVAATVVQPRSTAARQHLQSARELLATAQGEIDHGAAYTPDQLDEVAQLIDRAKLESRRQQQQEARKRAALVTGSSVGGASLLLLGLIGNRRRRDERKVATDLLESWDRTLKGKRDGLFALMDRTAIVVGSVADVEERGYTGETLRLARQTIKDVDELFIMSSCAEDIFDRAEQLVTPGNLAAKGVNFVAASRYLKAVRLLRDEPVRFSAGDQLESIIKGKRAESSGLLGRKEDYEPFEMSFEELIAAFDERAKRAVDTLDLIEESWETIPDRLKALQESIEESAGAEGGLRNQAALDQLFALGPVFEQLLPAAQEQQAAAAKLGRTDPVEALRGPATAGERMAREAASLVALAHTTRSDLCPALEETSAALRSAGRKTDWVGASLREFSQRADELAELARKASAASEITALVECLTALREAARDALALETQAAESSLPQIEATETLTQDTRSSLGVALEVAAETVMREEDLDPSVKLQNAREEVSAARHGLDRGAILAARSALEEASRLTADANQIIERSQTVQREFSSVSERAKRELESLQSDLPEVEKIVGRLAANYAPSALQLESGDPTAESRSTAEIQVEARKEWETATQNRAEAHRAYETAQLLLAATLLDQCADRSKYVKESLAVIREHEELLLSAGKENAAAFQDLDTRASGCQKTAAEFHVTERSRRALTAALEHLEQLRLPSAGAGLDNPFDTRSQLAALAQSFHEFEAGAHADKLLYEEAGRSIEAAAREMATARALARQAQTDNLADSAAITEGLIALDALDPQLERLRERIQTAHEDWEELDQLADRVASDASRFAAMLRGELQRAQAAAHAITAAAHRTREAKRWSGSYGISIGGSPGSTELEQARAWLNSGDYQAAHRLADNAQRAAAAAIAHAESQVAAQRRAEERRRREAAARSRRASSFSSSRSHSSSSFGGGSSSRSSSGSSRSSFSSGSGTSRSGW